MGSAFQAVDGETPGPGNGLERVRLDAPPGGRDEARIASGVHFLSRHSRLHASYCEGMLDRRIVPSLKLGQFHYLTDRSGVPMAFCNWAWLSAPVLEEVLATGRDLEAPEFSCGDLPFFYEFLAPFGHCRAVVRGLREVAAFEGRRIPAIRGEVHAGGPCVPRIHHFAF